MVWGDAYRITADGVTAARGMIEQNAIIDVNGDPLLPNNTDYSVRARVKRSAGLTAGTLRINAFSPTVGQIGAGLAVTRRAGHHRYQEFTADLFGAADVAAVGSDCCAFTPTACPRPRGESFLVDNIEIFPTNAAQNSSLVRGVGHRGAGSLRRRQRHHEHRREQRAGNSRGVHAAQ